MRRFGLLLLAVLALLGGCETTTTVVDPMATLTATDTGPRKQIAAMTVLDEQAPPDEAYLEALHRVVWRPGYTVQVREAAVDRLMVYDEDGLKRTLRQQLPRMTAWAGLTRLCEIIAEQGWIDLAPALASSWARPSVLADDDMKRPEYLALVRLVGEDEVIDTLFEMFLVSNKVSQQGLRTRLWELLHRLGERDRLVQLLAESELDGEDLFILDLRAGAVDLGIVPRRREEILWLRELRQPERREFWDAAVAAVRLLPERRRRDLAMRDLPIVVSAARHDPELIELDVAVMEARLEGYLREQKHYAHGSNFDNFNVARRERLRDWRGELTWGDLAAMLTALRALGVPQVVDHLFDYAERDRADESTEYGGVIALDDKGRFEVLEFPPRVRHGDQRFNASQAMFEAAYTSLFHFHYHAQRHRNDDYAGPGFGDVNYAENTRANCLVLTFVREDTMNVDFYRHGRVLVDLGVIRGGKER